MAQTPILLGLTGLLVLQSSNTAPSAVVGAIGGAVTGAAISAAVEYTVNRNVHDGGMKFTVISGSAATGAGVGAGIALLRSGMIL